MKIDYIRIKNFRGIPDVEFPFSKFVCIIGENNAGKSSILIALNLFYSGTKLADSDYFDIKKKIEIGMKFTDINDNDIERISESHRERFKGIIENSELFLKRIYDLNGKSRFFYETYLPKDPKFDEKEIDSNLKGKKSKDIEKVMIDLFPEYNTQFKDIKTKTKVKNILNEIISTIPISEKILKDVFLPTGLDSSIKTFLPEPLLVEAVKDLSDEVKTKQSATFGKLINFLMSLIIDSDKFKSISDSFKELEGLLNIIIDEKNQIHDNRLPQIQDIENKVEKYLQEIFPAIKLNIDVPPPDLNQIFSNTLLFLDDGVRGLIDTKGDGLKRSMVFSLLRAYVEIQRENPKSSMNEIKKKQNVRPYMILFEEPELYLHPFTQKIFFSALEGLSKNHYIVSTTHAPQFYSPDAIATFVHVRKDYPEEGKPYGIVKAINLLDDLSKRNLFRLICYENCSAAFFARKVLLVEGDSDLLYIRHISKILKNEWDFTKENIPIIRILGKGNIKIFREFFILFNVEIHTLMDLDVIIEGFNKLGLKESYMNEQSSIIQELDQLIQHENQQNELSDRNIRELISRRTFRQRYDKFRELVNKVKTGDILTDIETTELDLLFLDEVNLTRKRALKLETFEKVLKPFIYELYKEKIYILSKGSIEDYYPEGATGQDKTSKAISACQQITSEEDMIDLIPKFNINGENKSELSLIFQSIFGE